MKNLNLSLPYFLVLSILLAVCACDTKRTSNLNTLTIENEEMTVALYIKDNGVDTTVRACLYNNSAKTIGIDTITGYENWKNDELSYSLGVDLSYSKIMEFNAVPPNGTIEFMIPCKPLPSLFSLQLFYINDLERIVEFSNDAISLERASEKIRINGKDLLLGDTYGLIFCERIPLLASRDKHFTLFLHEYIK